MNKWEGLNKRKFPRVNYPCLVVLRNSSNNQDVILAHTENIGSGGMCVILRQDIRIFSMVEIELDLLDLANHIKCTGKVVWNVQRQEGAAAKPMFYDIGIEFEKIDPKDRERLEQIIDRLANSQKDVTFR